GFLRDMPGKWPPCLHERTFAGQRTANGLTVSCPQHRADRIGEWISPIRLYAIRKHYARESVFRSERMPVSIDRHVYRRERHEKCQRKETCPCGDTGSGRYRMLAAVDPGRSIQMRSGPALYQHSRRSVLRTRLCGGYGF